MNEIVETAQEKDDVVIRFKKPNKTTLVIGLICILLIAAVGIFLVVQDTGVQYTVLTEDEYPMQIAQQVIPEYQALERALAMVVDDKVYVMASRGEKPTGGYDIEINKLKLIEEDGVKTLQVYTTFKDPVKDELIAPGLTYPLQILETDLTFLPDQIELKVQYDK